MPDRALEGRIALITGANHGIGAAIALALTRDGADIFVSFYRPTLTTQETFINDGVYARQRDQGADAVLAAARTYDVRAEALEIDLANSTAIPVLFDRAEATLGDVSILINNAAAWAADTFVPPALRDAQAWPPPDIMGWISAESIDTHFAVNARANALLMAEFARRHIARKAVWGRIVNVSTDGAAVFPGEVSYGASKYALESYSRSAARELGPYGVTVNIVSPGPTQTGWITAELETEIAAHTPLRRIGQPEDVADVVALLMSDKARWLTGQLLRAGGGHGI
jgi:3-oxoacyl-[acyl-carrier protein] reductase